MIHPALDAPISPLRQRLIDDMNMRRFSRETQRNYLRDVGRLATFLGRSPDTATIDDLRRFQIEQQEDGVPVPTMNSIVSALRFFFTQTLDRPDLARRLVRLSHPRKLPVVLSRDEVARLLNATTCLKHQAALSVGRLIALDESGVTFRYKDYRRDGADRQQVMTLAPDEFIRRFLLHVLPRGFHRIRHYGLLAGSARKASLTLARQLLNVAAPPDDDTPDEPDDFRPLCPCCGGRMIVIEMFERWRQPRGPPHKTTANRETAP